MTEPFDDESFAGYPLDDYEQAPADGDDGVNLPPELEDEDG